MPHKLRRILDHLRYLWNARKFWSFPKPSEILIFDACGEALLRQYLGNWTVEVLPIRGESINVPILLASLFAPGKKSDAYFDAFIRRVRPKLIITFIDNTPAFYRLAARHGTARTMFVQNGWRSYYGDIFELLEKPSASPDSLAVDYMLCFGDAIADHYRRYITGTAIAMGSLRNNQHLQRASVRRGIIGFVSQWRREGLELGGRLYSHDEVIAAPDACIISFLSEYADRFGKQLHIITRTKPGDPDRADEKRYFSSLLGKECTFFERGDAGNSYEALDVAEVVIGVDSTLVYEAAARGAKTGVFSIRGTMIGVKGFEFGWPEKYADDGAFWTNSASPSRFREIVDYLFSVDEDEWRNELKRSGFERLMAFDPGNVVFETALRKALAHSPSAQTPD